MMILYSVSDGPPSVAVRMGLKLLNLEYKLQEVDFGTGEHLNDWYAEVNLSMFLLAKVIFILCVLFCNYWNYFQIQNFVTPSYTFFN